MSKKSSGKYYKEIKLHKTEIKKNEEKMLGKGMILIVFLLNEPISVKFNVGVIVARC